MVRELLLHFAVPFSADLFKLAGGWELAVDWTQTEIVQYFDTLYKFHQHTI